MIAAIATPKLRPKSAQGSRKLWIRIMRSRPPDRPFIKVFLDQSVCLGHDDSLKVSSCAGTRDTADGSEVDPVTDAVNSTVAATSGNARGSRSGDRARLRTRTIHGTLAIRDRTRFVRFCQALSTHEPIGMTTLFVLPGWFASDGVEFGAHADPRQAAGHALKVSGKTPRWGDLKLAAVADSAVGLERVSWTEVSEPRSAPIQQVGEADLRARTQRIRSRNDCQAQGCDDQSVKMGARGKPNRGGSSRSLACLVASNTGQTSACRATNYASEPNEFRPEVVAIRVFASQTPPNSAHARTQSPERSRRSKGCSSAVSPGRNNARPTPDRSCRPETNSMAESSMGLSTMSAKRSTRIRGVAPEGDHSSTTWVIAPVCPSFLG